MVGIFGVEAELVDELLTSQARFVPPLGNLLGHVSQIGLARPMGVNPFS